MNIQDTNNTLLGQLEFLLEKYSEEHRACTQPYRLKKVKNHLPEYEYNPDDKFIRETLLEHVGTLPIIATTFYPYINDSNVDLGRALVMLAIHDIGELEVHDQNTFTKLVDEKQLERQQALKLLHDSYHDIYDEMETRSTSTAKFAKAIDKIGPDLFDFILPTDVSLAALKHNGGVEASGVSELLIKHKRPYMLWNPFLTQFHEFLLERLKEKFSISSNYENTNLL